MYGAATRAAKSAMSSAVNRVCNVESVDSETTRFEWVVGSLSKYTLGDKVTSSAVSAGRTFGRICASPQRQPLICAQARVQRRRSGLTVLCARGRRLKVGTGLLSPRLRHA